MILSIINLLSFFLVSPVKLFTLVSSSNDTASLSHTRAVIILLFGLHKMYPCLHGNNDNNNNKTLSVH